MTMIEDLSMRIYNIEALLKVINNRITALESGHSSNEQTEMVKRNAARSCLGIVSKIKNDYSGPGYITVFNKIESGIKKEFDL